MNQRDSIVQENNVKRLFDMNDRSKTNCVRFNAGNTWEHELAKATLCWNLQQLGHSFLTEARFNDRSLGRVDVVDLTTGRVHEIVKSETEASILKKKENYPLEIVTHDAGMVNVNE